MDELAELYQEIILDHNRRPHNYRVMPDATHRAEGHNPLCGDDVEVFLRLDGGRVADISFSGHGCAISRASASLMTTVLKGRSLDEARVIFAGLRTLLQADGGELQMEGPLGELAPLGGVRHFPARVKCATLAWHAFAAAAEGKGVASTE
jgi:nitrogen fixation NifU-like protein